MPTQSDFQLISKLMANTEAKQIDWKPTALPGEFTASFAGKFTVTISEEWALVNAQRRTVIALRVKDTSGETILRIDSTQAGDLDSLFEMAKRRAMKVDEAIADLLKELDKPQ